MKGRLRQRMQKNDSSGYTAIPALREPLGIDPAAHCRLVLTGIVGSPGLAAGPVYLHTGRDLWVDVRRIGENGIDAEIARFNAAIEAVVEEKRRLQRRAEEEIGVSEGQIFESHIMLLEDPVARTETIERIRDERRNVEYCYYVTIQKVVNALSSIESHEYLRERVSDLEDVRADVLARLTGESAPDIDDIDERSVVIAHSLTPSDTARMRPAHVIGFVTDTGGPTSHASILARSMGIPAIVGCVGASSSIMPGDHVIVNGHAGEVYVDPDPDLASAVDAWRERLADRAARLLDAARLPSETLDGRVVRLELNIELREEIADAATCPGDGVGLFRTEFLFLSRDDWPSEEEQFETYRELACAFGSRPVTIRTMDIGGDKLSRRLHVAPENNPFLGWRAIRISLAQRDMFRTQLRAVLRASAHGNVRLMFPMITSVDEFRSALDVLEEARGELRERGEQFAPKMPVGVMIETPAAAMIAPALAAETDFFSVGTNDLVQYTLAVDRDNEHVAGLFDTYHPAVIRFIDAAVKAAQGAGIDISVCGEMAHEPLATMLLVGLGITGLSMAPGGIPEIRRLVRQFTLSEATKVARDALDSTTGGEVRDVLQAALNRFEANGGDDLGAPHRT